MEQGYNKNDLKCLYIITMVIAFIPRLGNLQFNKYIQLTIGAFWVFCAIVKLMISKSIFKAGYKKDIPWMLRSYLVPSLVLHGWTILLMCFGELSWENFTINITTYIPTLLAITSIYFFGGNAFKINFFALVSAYIISVLSSAVLIGPGIFVNAFTDAFLNRRILPLNYLELHDIVLAIGFVLVYYIFSSEKLNKKNISIIMVTILIMILGMKRVSVLGVVIAVLFHAVVKRMPEKAQYKACRMAGVVGIAACFFFVWILINGSWIWEIVGRIGIDPRGRSYYWTALAKRCEFSPTFLGLGRNYTYLLFSGELSYMNVGAAHSDILKVYAESGFFFFAYWLWHYLLRMTKRYKKRFSMNSALIYFGISIYLFTMYLTDNVETYFASIIFSITIPVCHALNHDRKPVELKKDTL